MSDLNPDSPPLSRVDLLQLAQNLGVSDADVMTRAELRAAIDKARRPDPIAAEQHATTWVSVARRLLASVVERGLNLPDAAALIRGDTKLNTPPKAPPPVATVTLARIYAAQGHLDRAIATLKEVLESDPDHDLANELRAQLELRRAETLARAGAARATAADDPGVTADSAPPASTAPDSLDPVPLDHPTAPSPAVVAALVSELAATAPETDAHGTPAPSAEPGAALSGDTARSETDGPTHPLPIDAAAFSGEAARSETEPASATEPAPLGEWTPAPDATANGVTGSLRGSGHEHEAGTMADFPAAPPSEPPPPARLDAPLGDVAGADALDGIAGSANGGAADRAAEDRAAEDRAAEDRAAEDRAPEDTPAPPPPAALRVDSSAELVAPAFATVERDASGPELSPAPTAFETEASARLDTASTDLASAPASLTDTDTEPPSTIATGIDALPVREPVQTEPSSPPEPAPVHAPNGVVNGVSLGNDPAASVPPPAALPARPTPEAPGLLLIETDTSIHYVYWELSAPDPSRPHWIHVVSHTPTPDGGADRRERRFPVHRSHGVLRLEGLPAHSIVRAKLTQTANDVRPLVVASSVRPRSRSGTEPFEVRYAPHARAKPEAIAHRAQPLLEHASPVYWD